MKKLIVNLISSKKCFIALLYVVSIFSLSIVNVEVKGMIIEEKKAQIPVIVKNSPEYVIKTADEIVNGKLHKGIDYLKILPFSDCHEKEESDIDASMLAYVYQVLGQYYMEEEKNAEKAAIAYFRSLKTYPLNYELTYYLRGLGVTIFSQKNIEAALNKILKK